MAEQRTSRVTALQSRRELPGSRVRVAQVARIDEGGTVFVDYRGNPSGPIRALLSLCEADCERLCRNDESMDVLLVDAEETSGAPVVIGLIASGVTPGVKDSVPDHEDTVHLDVTALVLEAKRDLILRCGKSQITMKADGTIVLRGTDLISRSSGPNRIRGATVRLN